MPLFSSTKKSKSRSDKPSSKSPSIPDQFSFGHVGSELSSLHLHGSPAPSTPSIVSPSANNIQLNNNPQYPSHTNYSSGSGQNRDKTYAPVSTPRGLTSSASGPRSDQYYTYGNPGHTPYHASPNLISPSIASSGTASFQVTKSSGYTHSQNGTSPLVSPSSPFLPPFPNSLGLEDQRGRAPSPYVSHDTGSPRTNRHSVSSTSHTYTPQRNQHAMGTLTPGPNISEIQSFPITHNFQRDSEEGYVSNNEQSTSIPNVAPYPQNGHNHPVTGPYYYAEVPQIPWDEYRNSSRRMPQQTTNNSMYNYSPPASSPVYPPWTSPARSYTRPPIMFGGKGNGTSYAGIREIEEEQHQIYSTPDGKPRILTRRTEKVHYITDSKLTKRDARNLELKPPK